VLKSILPASIFFLIYFNFPIPMSECNSTHFLSSNYSNAISSGVHFVYLFANTSFFPNVLYNAVRIVAIASDYFPDISLAPVSFFIEILHLPELDIISVFGVLLGSFCNC
jgi:hypothetical protein